MRSGRPGHARRRESLFESSAAFPKRWQSSRSASDSAMWTSPHSTGRQWLPCRTSWSDSLLGTVGHHLIHRFTLADIAKPFPRQLFDPGRIMLQPIDFSAQDGRGPLQVLDVPSKLLGMVAHGKIAWNPHFAEEEGQQQQQAHAGADILCTGHPAPLPIQPLPPAITFNDHTSPLASTRHGLSTTIDGGTSQLFLDPEQLIVLGHTIGPGQ